MLAKVRPDGHGIFTDGHRAVAFFVEHDVGGEQLGVLAAKLSRDAALAADGGPAWPVLFWLPTTARERHLHRLLDQVDTWVPVATATRDDLGADSSPAELYGWSAAPRMHPYAWWTWPISATLRRWKG